MGTQTYAIDLTGQIFNGVTALEKVSVDLYGNALWFCECRCGKFFEVNSLALRRNKRTCCPVCRINNAPKRKPVIRKKIILKPTTVIVAKKLLAYLENEWLAGAQLYDLLEAEEYEDMDLLLAWLQREFDKKYQKLNV